MNLGTRLRMKRGDTAPAFRARCYADGVSTPANLTGAVARMLLRQEDRPGLTQTLPMVVEAGLDGWVRHDWLAAETAVAGTWQLEVEVTYASGAVQTFPGAGYATVEILPDLG